MEWLDLEVVESLHEKALEKVGPPSEPGGYMPGGRKKLAGALQRPYFHHHFEGERPLSFFAAVYLVAVSKTHAFRQGNKRTALLSMRAFLVLNGQEVDLTFPSAKPVQDYVKGVAEQGVQELGDEQSSLSLRDVARWIEDTVYAEK